MKNVNGMKNLKQMKNVRFVLLVITMLTISLYFTNIKNVNAEEQIDYAKEAKLRTKTEAKIASIKAKADEIKNQKKDKYTQKDLEEDLKLSIEELRIKYPYNWFKERFGDGSGCDGDAPELYGDTCNVDEYIDYFSDKQIISIILQDGNNDGDIRKFPIISQVYCNIDKYKSMKDLIYRKDILENLNWFYDNLCKCVPENIPFFKDIIFPKIDHPVEYRRDKEMKCFSKEIQQEYKNSRKNKYNY